MHTRCWDMGGRVGRLTRLMIDWRGLFVLRSRSKLNGCGELQQDKVYCVGYKEYHIVSFIYLIFAQSIEHRNIDKPLTNLSTLTLRIRFKFVMPIVSQPNAHHQQQQQQQQ